jgi:hypothetical protein
MEQRQSILRPISREVFMIGKPRFTAQVSNTNTNSQSQRWVRGVSPSQSGFEEKVLAVFQPDILISAQYLATYRRRFHLNPEQVLMLAVLEDAIICFQDHVAATCKRKRLLHLEAEEWILDEDRSYLFSFENICDSLGFEPTYLRQGLMRWKEAALENRSRSESNVNRWPSKRVNNGANNNNRETPPFSDR